MNNITLILLLIIFLFILDKTIPQLLEAAKIKSETDRRRYGYITKQDFYKFNSVELDSWFRMFVQDMGYEIIKVIPEEFDGSKELICRRGEENYYIKWEPGDGDKAAMQKLVGAMVVEKIKKGVIITVEKFTEQARLYVQSLSSDYSLELIDGDELIKICWEHREKQIRSHMQKESQI